MKYALFFLFTASHLSFATPVGHKRKNDPCPKGQHEVVITETKDLLKSKDSTQVVHIKETRKVCRDNGDTVTESPVANAESKK